MKSVATILAVSAVLAVVSASGYGGGASGGAGGYGAASIPAPPCPKNYLFSCQPNLAPAPCSQAAGGYGSAGAYSENIPSVVNVPYQGYQAVPQSLQQYQNSYGQNTVSY